MPDRSGTFQIKIRRQPDPSGCCLIKIRHAWYQANLSAWSILLRQIRRSGKQRKFVRSLATATPEQPQPPQLWTLLVLILALWTVGWFLKTDMFSWGTNLSNPKIYIVSKPKISIESSPKNPAYRRPWISQQLQIGEMMARKEEDN